jgi:outer membrane protein assembly factor BamB
MCTSFHVGAQSDTNWPSFRGHRASGIAEGYETPTSWKVAEVKNIAWKTPIPGLAHSSPVVWGDSIFLTTAVAAKDDPVLRVGRVREIDSVVEDAAQSWRVYRLDKKTGKILWERIAHEGVPKVKRHAKSTHANPTPATDGERVVAFFGSEGLYCYDLSGELLWKKDLGVLDSNFFQAPEAQWGFASSPIIHDGKVFVQCDVRDDSFLAVFAIEDGSDVWRVPRSDVPTWSTPNVHTVDGRDVLLVNGWRHIGAYEVADGKEIWRLTGGGDIPVPTPIVGHGLVFITNSHGPFSPIYAIDLDAKGDISLAEDSTSNEHVVWSTRRGGAYMPTPLVYGDYFYLCRDNGVLSCYKATTGEQMYQERLGSGTRFSASSVAAEGKLYFTSEMGDVFVVRAGPKFELIATNSLDEIAMATPAISEGTLYYRTRSHLIAIAEK